MHFRLGHPNFRYLKHLFPSLFTNKDPRSFHCDIFQLSKDTRSNYSPSPYKPSHLFSLIHGDIWGPTKIPNVTCARWFLLLVDDHTHLSWTFLMKEKSNTSQLFKNFHAIVKTEFQMSIQVLKTNNARDFFNSTIGPYLLSNGIVRQRTCMDTPQQNGEAEHKNRHLLKVARSLLFTSKIPKQF